MSNNTGAYWIRTKRSIICTYGLHMNEMIGENAAALQLMNMYQASSSSDTVLTETILIVCSMWFELSVCDGRGMATEQCQAISKTPFKLKMWHELYLSLSLSLDITVSEREKSDIFTANVARICSPTIPNSFIVFARLLSLPKWWQ